MFTFVGFELTQREKGRYLFPIFFRPIQVASMVNVKLRPRSTMVHRGHFHLEPLLTRADSELA